jgi:two-component system, NtrC family, response regulator PilR
VLVIDDEPDLRTLYELSLTREGYDVTVAGSVMQALSELSQHRFHVVVSDMQLPDGLGLEVLKFLLDKQRSERCVVITAHGSAENAVEALKAGAFDYLSKPVDLKQFRAVVAQAVELSLAEHGPRASAPSVGAAATSRSVAIDTPLMDPSIDPSLAAIVGSSNVMQQLRARVAKVARSMAPVLIRGESGTGKELVARAIHACSHRSAGPFVAVNCGAIAENLLEAEFFGVRKGAYTGATADREGFFQVAQGGTLFLDEVGDLPLAMQAKLLRAIQERAIRPVGDTQEISVNARIVSATHRDLAAGVAAGSFRQDLFYRINVIDIGLPALRDRIEDLSELVAHLLQRIAEDSGAVALRASADFLRRLSTLPLKGNVRELENLLHRAVALSDGETLLLDDAINLGQQDLASPSSALSPSSGAMPSALPRDLQAHLDEQERQILIKALRDSSFNRTAAAARLGMTLRQIRYRMARLGIEVDESKS